MQGYLNKKAGSSGEAVAESYLIKCGYKILFRNFTTQIGEIDLIASDGKTIVFIEVKARKSLKFGRPSEAVTPHKINKIRQVATQYLRRNNMLNSMCRIDVVEVLDGEVNHIINVS